MDYKNKYIKYKIKYLQLKGGNIILKDAIVSWYIQKMKKIVKEDFEEEITITSSELKQKEKTDEELLEILKEHKKLYEYINNPNNKHINMIINIYRQEFKKKLEKKIISERSYIVKIIYFIFNFIFSLFKSKNIIEDEENTTDLDDLKQEKDELEEDKSTKKINKLLEEEKELKKLEQEQEEELEKIVSLSKRQQFLEDNNQLIHKLRTKDNTEQQYSELISPKSSSEPKNYASKELSEKLEGIKSSAEENQSNENQAQRINQLRIKQPFDNLKKIDY